MTFALRSAIVSLALTAGAFTSAHADLTIPFQATQSNSVQKFSEDIMGAFELVAITVEAKGNGVAVGTAGDTFSFPITKIVINNQLKIASGSAVGSGLFISRLDKGELRGVTLANFTINYVTKQVLADTTALGGATTTQMPLYTFNEAVHLALKYKFPLTITGHEELNELHLTEEAKAVMKTALNLPTFTHFALDLDYGTLTQDVSTKIRKPAASTKPYTP